MTSSKLGALPLGPGLVRARVCLARGLNTKSFLGSVHDGPITWWGGRFPSAGHWVTDMFSSPGGRSLRSCSVSGVRPRECRVRFLPCIPISTDGVGTYRRVVCRAWCACRVRPYWIIICLFRHVCFRSQADIECSRWGDIAVHIQNGRRLGGSGRQLFVGALIPCPCRAGCS